MGWEKSGAWLASFLPFGVNRGIRRENSTVWCEVLSCERKWQREE